MARSSPRIARANSMSSSDCESSWRLASTGGRPGIDHHHIGPFAGIERADLVGEMEDLGIARASPGETVRKPSACSPPASAPYRQRPKWRASNSWCRRRHRCRCATRTGRASCARCAMLIRPEPRNMFEVGQWATAEPVSDKRRHSRSERWMPWAKRLRGPSSPKRS